MYCSTLGRSGSLGDAQHPLDFSGDGSELSSLAIAFPLVDRSLAECISGMKSALKSSGFRLARADVSASAHADDLEYALEGLASKSLAVRRRSALDAAALCADPKERAQLFRAHGALPRITAAISASPCDDMLHAMAVCGLLYALASEKRLVSDEDLITPLTSSLLNRLIEVSDQQDLTTDVSQMDIGRLWHNLQQLCMGAIRTDAPCPAVHEVPAVLRRLCVLALARCAQDVEACRVMRVHPNLHELIRIIQVGLTRAPCSMRCMMSHEPKVPSVDAPRPHPYLCLVHCALQGGLATSHSLVSLTSTHNELCASLAILEASSFPAEEVKSTTSTTSTTSREMGAVAERGFCPGGSPLNLLPIMQVGEMAASHLYDGSDQEECSVPMSPAPTSTRSAPEAGDPFAFTDDSPVRRRALPSHLICHLQ